ncbi:hypothetical protein [Mycolicibacterium sp. lyk4-40-TYG-92]|uniref:hypothetical protein n=1 Tax=Mycolicibacterium sp. lyk4-40-TYG-92 TaxID=3040295 RepID=UPI00254BD84A|nr:hypothetical protein [Mycolicibacterium sp. lyk4-40-TYG-92]
MPTTHARKSTANPQQAAIALLASAAVVSAGVLAASPQAKTVATHLPEITRQVNLTAGSDPISLIQGLLALPTSILGNGQWINNLAYLMAQPLVAADSALYALDTAAAPVVTNAAATLLSPLAATPVAPAVEAALQEYFKNAAFPPTAFSGGGLTGFNFYDLILASLYDFSAPATALFPAAVTLLEKLGIPLPLPGNVFPNAAATNAALTPAVAPAAASPQDLIGGLGGLLTSALSTVWNDGAYLASIPLQIGVQTAATLLFYGPAAVFNPPLLFNLLTSYIPNYIRWFTEAGINGFVSTTTQFISSLVGGLGSLLPAAAAPLAAAGAPKLQTAAAVTPSISPAVSAPQDLIGGLGNVVSSAVSMVANDVAYAVNLPLAVAVPVVIPLVAGLPYTLAPQVLAGLLTTNLPNALGGALANTVHEIVSQAGQFVSSLGGLVPAAAAPLAATSVPKIQTNLIKVSNPTTASSAPNTAAGSKPGKTGSNDKSKTGADKAGSDTTGTDKTGSDPTGTEKKPDKGGKHRKPTDSGEAGSDNGSGQAGAGENKGGSNSHDSDGSKHSSEKSGSGSHGTGDGHGAGSRGGSGGHGGGK